MTLAMKLLCRVVRRRVQAGEALETVLLSYPKLTTEELALIREEMEGKPHE